MPSLEPSELGTPALAGPEQNWRIVLVTGLSGAGKTTALKALEDAGYEVVDNLPLSFMHVLVCETVEQHRSLAIGVDIRTRDFAVKHVGEQLDRLLGLSEAISVSLLFLDCDDEVIARRFTETRRRHPLALDRSPLDGILYERQLLSPLRDRSDLVIDTSLLSPHELRRLVTENFRVAGTTGRMSVFVTSFSYRYGLPREADLVFDVRFLKNPHYDTALRDLTGLDEKVADYIKGDPGLAPFVAALEGLFDILLPRYESEGKSYLTIAFGCTGGKHRSVFLTERMANWFRDSKLRVQVLHRELERAEAQFRQAKVSA